MGRPNVGGLFYLTYLRRCPNSWYNRQREKL